MTAKNTAFLADLSNGDVFLVFLLFSDSIFWSDCLARTTFMDGYLRTWEWGKDLDTDYCVYSCP